MWSHVVLVGIGSKAVAVGTDAPQVIDLLAPWTIEDIDESEVELVDYGIELHAEATESSSPKPLPRLMRGSCVLVANRDSQQIKQALLQSLATHGNVARPGTMRIELAPVIRDGVAVLIPARSVLPMSERWLNARGMARVNTVSSMLDPELMVVELDQPLGSSVMHDPLPFGGWFLPATDVDEFTPGRAVAQAMGLALDVTDENAGWHLEKLADCVLRQPPRATPATLAEWDSALTDAFGS